MRRLRYALGLALVAVLAGGAGVGLAWPFMGSANGSPAAGSGANSPSYVAPGGVAPGGRAPGGGAPGGSASGVAPGQGGGSGVVTQFFLTGQVTAVSPTSITIAGDGPSITAAVTSQTRITGRAHSIGAIRVGDRVSAQIMQSGGKTTANAIQYPPQQPADGSVP